MAGVKGEYSKDAEVTVPSLDDWEKQWKNNPQGIVKPAVVRAWQNGAISRETMLPLFRRSEILPEGRTDHPGRTCQSGLAGRGFISTTQERSAETALGGKITAGDASDVEMDCGPSADQEIADVVQRVHGGKLVERSFDH